MAKKQFANEAQTDMDEGVLVTPSAKERLSPILKPVEFAPYPLKNEEPWQSAPSGYDIRQARRDILDAYNKKTASSAADEESADDNQKTAVKKADGKKVRFVPIFLALLSLLTIAVLIVGEYALQTELALVGTKSGLGFIFDLIDIFKGGSITVSDLLLPVSVAVIALAAVVNVIASLVKIKSMGACVASKISIFFMLLFSIVMVQYALLDSIDMSYGMYAVGGLSFIMLLAGYLAKNK